MPDEPCFVLSVGRLREADCISRLPDAVFVSEALVLRVAEDALSQPGLFLEALRCQQRRRGLLHGVDGTVFEVV